MLNNESMDVYIVIIQNVLDGKDKGNAAFFVYIH